MTRAFTCLVLRYLSTLIKMPAEHQDRDTYQLPAANACKRCISMGYRCLVYPQQKVCVTCDNHGRGKACSHLRSLHTAWSRAQRDLANPLANAQCSSQCGMCIFNVAKSLERNPTYLSHSAGSTVGDGSSTNSTASSQSGGSSNQTN
jgi:hypothetical protein